MPERAQQGATQIRMRQLESMGGPAAQVRIDHGRLEWPGRHYPVVDAAGDEPGRLERIRKYGAKSEKLSDAQLELLEAEPGVSTAGAWCRHPPGARHAGPGPGLPSTGRGARPAHHRPAPPSPAGSDDQPRRPRAPPPAPARRRGGRPQGQRPPAARRAQWPARLVITALT